MGHVVVSVKMKGPKIRMQSLQLCNNSSVNDWSESGSPPPSSFPSNRGRAARGDGW